VVNIIEVKDLHYEYKDGTRALKGLSFSVPQGARVALLGPNGAGKSTLLLHLNGINMVQKGQVILMGRELGEKQGTWARSQVGMVFQDPDDQVFSATVEEDVAFGPVNMGLSRQEIQARVDESLRAVGMAQYREKAPYHLSYGQKKRVAIAGVLAMRPGIIVLDEPMAYLDPRGKEDLLTILEDLHRSGVTIIIATHDVDMAVEWADQVILIKGGITLAQGDTSLLTNPELVREAHLRLPIVTRIFRSFPGLYGGEIPCTVARAVSIIQDLVEKKGFQIK
jgi:cobalt/nickel transport system ATP-binding protein